METIELSGGYSGRNTVKTGTGLNKKLTGFDGAGEEENTMPFNVLHVHVHVSKTKQTRALERIPHVYGNHGAW